MGSIFDAEAPFVYVNKGLRYQVMGLIEKFIKFSK
jgi:hypothetical protein